MLTFTQVSSVTEGFKKTGQKFTLKSSFSASETTQGPIDLQLMEGQIHWVTCFYECRHYFSFLFVFTNCGVV